LGGFAQRDACPLQAGSKRQPLTPFVGRFGKNETASLRKTAGDATNVGKNLLIFKWFFRGG
jgi:hypothetical protein